MPNPKRSLERTVEVLQAFEDHGTISKAARALGVSHTCVARILKQNADIVGKPDFEVASLPSEDMHVGELLAARSQAFLKRAKAKEAKRLIHVKVNLDGPIGIAHFGDPHVDDDGTNIVALQRHVAVVKRTEGLFAGNVGDTTNNWIGRLARLYGEQGTTAKHAWQLAEWLFTEIPWLYAVGGNHDCWSGSGDPLQWISKQAGVLYQPHGVRLSLNLPNGRSVIINARHDFKGHSMWNTAHGVGKAIQMGWRDHVATCGHLHTSGYQVLRDPATRRISHGLRVGSYKTYDKYAEAEGLPDQNIFVCPITVIDPRYDDTDPRFIQVLFDPESGADYLKFLRKRKAA